MFNQRVKSAVSSMAPMRANRAPPLFSLTVRQLAAMNCRLCETRICGSVLALEKSRRWSAALVLLFGAGGSIFAAGEAGCALLRQQYRRPARIPYPNDNPFSRAKYELGRTLFFDPILSGAKVRSCSSCHNPGLSWADGQPRAIGENQKPLSGLRTPTLLNVAWTPKLGWDGHFHDLEGVAIGPITSTDNMNLPERR